MPTEVQTGCWDSIPELFDRFRRVSSADVERKRAIFHDIQQAVKIRLRQEEEALLRFDDSSMSTRLARRLDRVLEDQLVTASLLLRLSETTPGDADFDLGMDVLLSRLEAPVRRKQGREKTRRVLLGDAGPALS